MNISYKRDMTHNYMVPEAPESISEDDYRVHMLTENHIRGLLPCSLKSVNCQRRFFYDITSRQSMEQLYGNAYMQTEEIRTLLRGLYRALTEVKKYLLDMDCIVLDPQMIYLDVETRQPLFCYLPGYHKDILESFREWTAYLLEHLNRSDDQAVLLGYGIYRKAREINYPLEKILQEAGSAQERSADAERERLRRAWENEESRMPTWEQENVRQKRQDPYKDSRSEDIFDRDDAFYKEEEHPRRKNERGGGAGTGKKKTRVPLMVGFGCAAALTLAAAWFWGLSTTQIGGIIFLLAGLLAYGCSLESKKKKNPEEWPADYEEQPYYEPEPGRRAGGDAHTKKQNRAARTEREKKRAPGSAKGGRYQETPPSYDPPRYREAPQPYEAPRRHETRSGQAAPYRGMAEGSIRLGDTGVLYAEDGGYDTYLVLESMNPHQRESIILEKDSYIVGKLAAQSDIVVSHPSVSRIHAKIERRGGDYYLCDLNSTNGTFINGRRLSVNESAVIRPSDEIAFARVGYYVRRC